MTSHQQRFGELARYGVSVRRSETQEITLTQLKVTIAFRRARDVLDALATCASQKVFTLVERKVSSSVHDELE